MTQPKESNDKLPPSYSGKVATYRHMYRAEPKEPIQLPIWTCIWFGDTQFAIVP